MTVGDLEVLRRKMIGRVGAEVDRVKAGRLVSWRLHCGVVPALRAHGVRTTVGRS